MMTPSRRLRLSTAQSPKLPVENPGQVRPRDMGLRGLRVLLIRCDLDIVLTFLRIGFCDPGHVLTKALVTSDVKCLHDK